MRTILSVTASAVMLLAACGCGDQNRTVYPVRGRVLYNGKPMVGGGSISLVPLEKVAGKAAGAEIREDGTFELMTYVPGDGAFAGEHRVIINQTTVREPDVVADGQGMSGEAIVTVADFDRIPAIHSDLKNSPKTIVVAEEENNDMEINLTPVGPPPGA